MAWPGRSLFDAPEWRNMSRNNFPRAFGNAFGNLYIWTFAAVIFAGVGHPWAALTKMDMERAKFSVGAGSMAYLAQQSPSTGLALDTRLEYPLNPNLAVEGAATTAFSQSVRGESETIPLLLDGSVKVRPVRSDKVDLYAAAGLGYGAYLGTQRLEDGATFGIPLSVGAEWQRKNLGFAPRFTYRPVFGDQLGTSQSDADSWTAVLDVQLPFL
ncbi:MAG: hypothetical protein JWO30_1724 [Fibrobacteres bacterium]|nr:hypothetical protein [Fibrobacterota bacterium]